MDRFSEALRPFHAKFIVTEQLHQSCINYEKCTPGTAEQVWDVFRRTMATALDDPALNLNATLGPAREDGSIFLSIASYRDETCSQTLRRAYQNADHPELLSVGIVQQNCDKACVTWKGWADTRHMEEQAGPDPDCIEDFCKSDLGQPHCKEDRVRILRLNEMQAFGPFFARYLNSRMWRGENFFMQTDAHMGFRSGWDATLRQMMKLTPSYPKSVISTYPANEDEDAPKKLWERYDGQHEALPSALCSLSFEDLPDGRGKTVRLSANGRATDESSLQQPGLPTPMRSCFVAAGFYIAHSSLIEEVPFDPFLPFIFMGEEIALSYRFWTAGFDIYAPSVDVISHVYGRHDHPKFWETVTRVSPTCRDVRVFSQPSMHNDLTALIMPRIQHLVGFPEKAEDSSVQPSSLMEHMGAYSASRVRSGEAFNVACGLNYKEKKQETPGWCVTGEGVPQELFAVHAPQGGALV